MRTKTLVSPPRWVVAGMPPRWRQVYSVNAVVTVKVTVPVGFSIIAESLGRRHRHNVLSKLFTAPSDGTTIQVQRHEL